MSKPSVEDVKFAYSKATIEYRDKYNAAIDDVIRQLEGIKVKGDKFDVKAMQDLRSDLSRVNSMSNRKHVERAYTDFYDSATLDLQKCVEEMANEK